MSSALLYCTNEYERAHQQIRKNKAIFDAFEVLAIEIAKLSHMEQINLYSVTTQFIESLVKQQVDIVNPIDVFILRSNSIINANTSATKVILLALGIVAISLSVIVSGVALGFGAGLLLGLWSAPLACLAAFMAAEPAAIVIVTVSTVVGIATGFLSKLAFFREPPIKKSLDICIEEIKKSYLPVSLELANEQCLDENAENISRSSIKNL